MNHKTRIRSVSKTRWLKLVVFVFGCIAFGCVYSANTDNSPAKVENAVSPSEPSAQASKNSDLAKIEEENAISPANLDQTDKDYSQFKHDNDFHSRLPCLLCHQRESNSSKIGFPGKVGHMPCAGCHAVQFSSNTSPMCTICHTDTGMKRFPGLTSFSAKFDHGRHTRVNCSVCHKSQQRGVAFSIPSGASAHSTCFECHSSSAPASMSSCSVCHVPGRLARTSEWSIAFRKSFSHAKHLNRGKLNCATCHSVRPGASRGRQMSSPLVSMHFAPPKSLSCGGCHNGKKAFGPDDFANCQRCHHPKTFKF